MAQLQIVRLDDKDGTLLLQGTGDPSQNADFSLYDLDGDGGDPFAFGNQTWEVLKGSPSIEYSPEDSDTFWAAVEECNNYIQERSKS